MIFPFGPTICAAMKQIFSSAATKIEERFVFAQIP
jgi:hypothetical protein